MVLEINVRIQVCHGLAIYPADFKDKRFLLDVYRDDTGIPSPSALDLYLTCPLRLHQVQVRLQQDILIRGA